ILACSACKHYRVLGVEYAAKSGTSKATITMSAGVVAPIHHASWDAVRDRHASLLCLAWQHGNWSFISLHEQGDVHLLMIAFTPLSRISQQHNGLGFCTMEGAIGLSTTAFIIYQISFVLKTQ
ncbi:hypothetical protein DPSP01_014729, partial [Paraphaeosphaeria sporulosa]